MGYRDSGYLFEFGMEKRKNADQCIEAVFTKKFNEIFGDPRAKGPFKEYFILGVAMNAKASEIMKGLKVLKLKPGGKVEKWQDWELII